LRLTVIAAPPNWRSDVVILLIVTRSPVHQSKGPNRQTFCKHFGYDRYNRQGLRNWLRLATSAAGDEA